MNLGITLGFKADGTVETLVSADQSFSQQRRNFRKLFLDNADNGFVRLELWSSSSGRVKRSKYKSGVSAVLLTETISDEATETDSVTDEDGGEAVSEDTTPEADAGKPWEVETPAFKKAQTGKKKKR